MKKIAFLLSFLMVISLGCKQSGNKKTGSQKASSKAFVSEKYGFEVNFPQTPNKSKDSYVVDGKSYPVTVFSHEVDNNSVLTVMVFELPGDYAKQVDPSKTVMKQVKNTAASLDLTEISTKENSYPGYPSVIYEGQGSDIYGMIEGVATDKYVYIVAALAQGPNSREFVQSKGKKFIKSFKVSK